MKRTIVFVIFLFLGNFLYGACTASSNSFKIEEAKEYADQIDSINNGTDSAYKKIVQSLQEFGSQITADQFSVILNEQAGIITANKEKINLISPPQEFSKSYQTLKKSYEYYDRGIKELGQAYAAGYTIGNVYYFDKAIFNMAMTDLSTSRQLSEESLDMFKEEANKLKK